MAPAAASMPGEEEKALLLVKAMIAAAKADGEIDAAERAAILAHVDEQDAEARAFVEAELQKPLDLYEITSRVRDEATAREVYAASFLAIEVDTPAERGFLDRLAARLGLEPAQAAEIETRLEADAG